MPTIFHALDNEFAVSTGSNLDTATGQSTFDDPPNSFVDLVVSAKAGDARPGAFQNGETYDISYGSADGTVELSDAVVIRSHHRGPDKGVIVFEGQDAGGNLIHVIWTPNFDLEQWHSDHISGGAPPGWWTEEHGASYFEFVCFAPDTLIRTPAGDRPVVGLRPGDLVTTLDHGPQPLIWTGSRTLRFPPSPVSQMPVAVRAGALGAGLPRRDLVVSPQHRFLMTGGKVSHITGSPEALVRAKSLVPLPGVRIMRQCGEVTYVTLLFARHQIILAEGTPVESFYPGPWAMSLLDPIQQAQVIALLPAVFDDVRAAMGPPARPALAHRRALALARRGDLVIVEPRDAMGRYAQL